MAVMRDLGMGKRLAEERMLEELQFLIELIKSFQGELECFILLCRATAKTSGLLWKTNTGDLRHFQVGHSDFGF